MVRIGLVITFIGVVLVGFASKKVGGFDNYMNSKMICLNYQKENMLWLLVVIVLF